MATLQQRAAARLSAEGAGFTDLPAADRREQARAVVFEELESWVAHRAEVGLAALTHADEDELVAAVHAALGGLGPFEALLAREDVEDIFFNGTAPVMLRLADGAKVAGPVLATSDTQLLRLLQQLAGSGLDDSAGREFSVARPLLALRMRSVGLLGARLSAANDVTPHPAGTIRVHRHVETSLPRAARAGPDRCGVGGVADRAGARRRQGDGLRLAGGGQDHRAARVVCGDPAGSDDRHRRGRPRARVACAARHAAPTVGCAAARTARVVLLRPAALVRSYEARPANSEGRGQVSMGDLLHQSLRDSPDVIVVGETRGADVVHLLDAASNGVAGVMCTIHAETARGVFDRVVQMVRKAHPPLPADYALMAATSLDVIVHVARNRDHQRYVTEVIEVATGQLGESGYPVCEQLFAARARWAGRAHRAQTQPRPGGPASRMSGSTWAG